MASWFLIRYALQSSTEYSSEAFNWLTILSSHYVPYCTWVHVYPSTKNHYKVGVLIPASLILYSCSWLSSVDWNSSKGKNNVGLPATQCEAKVDQFKWRGHRHCIIHPQILNRSLWASYWWLGFMATWRVVAGPNHHPDVHSFCQHQHPLMLHRKHEAACRKLSETALRNSSYLMKTILQWWWGWVLILLYMINISTQQHHHSSVHK
jgi:hypothetical protein